MAGEDCFGAFFELLTIGELHQDSAELVLGELSFGTQHVIRIVVSLSNHQRSVFVDDRETWTRVKIFLSPSTSIDTNCYMRGKTKALTSVVKIFTTVKAIPAVG